MDLKLVWFQDTRDGLGEEVVLVGPGTKYMERLEFGLPMDPFERLVRTILSYSQQLKLM